jgi:hypothetical protein
VIYPTLYWTRWTTVIIAILMAISRALSQTIETRSATQPTIIGPMPKGASAAEASADARARAVSCLRNAFS